MPERFFMSECKMCGSKKLVIDFFDMELSKNKYTHDQFCFPCIILSIHECFGDKTLEFFTDFYKTHLEENELFFKKAEKISKIRKYMTDKVGIEDARFFVGDRNVRSNVNGEEK